MINADKFKRTLGRFATGVIVITTVDYEGKLHGMTANSFTSVSLSPPLILVCVDTQNQTHAFIKDQRKFDIIRAELGKNGIPCLQGSLGFLGCSLVAAHLQGDHTIYVGNVEEIITNDSPDGPLIFYESNFRELNSTENQ